MNNTATNNDDSQEAYNQIADDLYGCLDKWADAKISGDFALHVSLDLFADFTRDVFPADEAESFIRNAIEPYDGDQDCQCNICRCCAEQDM